VKQYLLQVLLWACNGGGTYFGFIASSRTGCRAARFMAAVLYSELRMDCVGFCAAPAGRRCCVCHCLGNVGRNRAQAFYWALDAELFATPGIAPARRVCAFLAARILWACSVRHSRCC